MKASNKRKKTKSCANAKAKANGKKSPGPLRHLSKRLADLAKGTSDGYAVTWNELAVLLRQYLFSA